jgi:hypothetical protein
MSRTLSRPLGLLALLLVTGSCGESRRAVPSDPEGPQPKTPIAADDAWRVRFPLLGVGAAPAPIAGGFQVDRGSLSARLPDRASGVAHLASRRAAGAWIDVRPLDLDDVAGEPAAGAIAYRSARAGVDLLIGPTHDGLEEVRVLRAAAFPTVARWRVTLGPHLAQLRAREGHLEAVDRTGYVHLATAPMFVVDANGQRRDVSVSVAREGETFVAEARFDGAGLVAPVVLDPIWSTAASLASARTRHFQVALTTGKVLVGGGTKADGTPVSSGEIYAPATNTWTTVGTCSGGSGSYVVPGSWTSAVAALPGGRAKIVDYVTRCVYDESRSPKYGPQTSGWEPDWGDSGVAVSTASALGQLWMWNDWTTDPGRVYVVGGDTTTNPLYGGYPSMAWPCVGASGSVGARVTTAGAERLLFIGGKHAGSVTATVNVFDPVTMKCFWPPPALKVPRYRPQVAVLPSNKVLVVGGTNDVGTELSSGELFDPETKTSTYVTPAPMPLVRPFTFAAVGSLFVAVRGADTMIFDPAQSAGAGAWTTVTGLPSVRYDTEGTAIANGVILTGGEVPGAGVLATSQLFTMPKLGDACAVDADCGFLGGCRDGVCCDTKCAGTCVACSAAKKGGGVDGTCGPIVDGADPDAECAKASCAGATLTKAQVCNGAGACRASGTTACTAGYACASAAACAASCARDADCTGGFYCDASSHCVTKLTGGAACTAAGQCASGSCADGVCCDGPCVGACVACTHAKKGFGVDGVCENVALGTNPRGSCAVDPGYPSSCKSDGLCDGKGACRYYALEGTACGPTTCAAGVITGKVCDGFGACGSRTTACAPNGCAASGDACSTTCAADADCTEGFCTATHVCASKRKLGDGCADARECASGHCVDGVCCNNACDGQCAACAETGSVGTCTAIAGAPRGTRKACDGAGTTCVGTCDGVNALACNYPGTLVRCGGACASGKETRPVCDGKGACVTGEPIACGAYVCDVDRCKTACVGDDDCATGYRCGGGTCSPSAGGKCSDDLTVATANDGTQVACAPYRCDATLGICRRLCASSDDCLAGYSCDTASRSCQPLGTGSDGGGCDVGGDASGGAAGVGLAILGLALAGLGRRRAR